MVENEGYVQMRRVGMEHILMKNQSTNVESRWPILFALGAVISLRFALPKIFFPESFWLLISAFAVLAALVLFFHSRGAEHMAYILGVIMISAVTVALMASLFLLIRSLSSPRILPLPLLHAAVCLWGSNCWYSRLGIGSWTPEVPT
jgi:hypothetical protein